MALMKNSNSFVSLAEAELYFADRLDVDAWTSANDTQKSQALVTATTMLCCMEWTGVAVSESQNLAFPRTGYYFDPKLGMETSLQSVSSYMRLSFATYELAYHLLNNDGLLDDAGEVEDLEVGNILLKKLSAPNKMPSIVMRKIRPMLANQGSKMWWRAN